MNQRIVDLIFQSKPIFHKQETLCNTQYFLVEIEKPVPAFLEFVYISLRLYRYSGDRNFRHHQNYIAAPITAQFGISWKLFMNFRSKMKFNFGVIISLRI